MRRQSLNTLTTVQLAALIVLALSVATLGLLALQTRNALCSFRGDLQARADANQALVDAHPDDAIIHAYGISIPRSVLENNLRGQQATLRSLDTGWPSLRC